MALPAQRIVPGRLEQAYRQEWNRLSAAEAIPKMWSKQANLWKDDADHAKVIANRLGWIPVLDSARADSADLARFAAEVAANGLRDVVLLGMGGSSLAPEVFSLTFPPIFCVGLHRSGVAA
jgi:glucose-6-phosphate isomerase